MSRAHAIQKAFTKAQSRDRKHKKRMTITGASVFALQKLLRAKR